MDNDTIIILFCVVIAAVLIYMIRNNGKEGFGFPFGSLTSTPQPPNVITSLPAPYCTNKLGQPVPCPYPCQGRCKTCDWDFPVPVFGPNQGAYSPSKFCPGPPLC